MVRFPNVRPTILAAVLAALLLPVLAACGETPLNTFDPKSDAADSIMTIYMIVIVAATLVGVAFFIAMIWILIKYRSRPGHQARQIHGHAKLEIAWTIAPVFVLLIVTIPTMFWIAGTADDPSPQALEVRAIGHQWWFEFRYPGLGPDGTDLVTANELHIPVGRQVAITLQSDDLLHSFWVPKLVGKTDMIPGRINSLQLFTPNEVGVFWGRCAEFCGSAHAKMHFRVHVDTLGDFNAWAKAVGEGQAAPPEVGTAAARGQKVFELIGGCSACHTIAGTAAAGRIGPDLSLFGERGTLAAGITENTEENLRSWISDVRSIKPIDEGPLFMPTFKDSLSEREIADVAAYLKSLTLN
jgi:cytochrome c oxidase subunit 2